MKSLSAIPAGTRPNVLLLGNGINRAFDFGSWDDLIGDIQTVNLSEKERWALKRLPYPLQPVVLTGDHVGTGMKKAAASLCALTPVEEQQQLLRMAADRPVDAILTTNYTYELEKSLNPAFSAWPGRRCSFRQLAYDSEKAGINASLHTYMEVAPGKPVWHIHGEAAKPDTMILGHYYYGKLLSHIRDYVPTLIRRYAGHHSAGRDMICRSWVDYFMLGNVRIIGLGLDLSEMDLWWLINCKKRHFPETTITFCCPDITLEKEMLCRTYNVQMVTSGLENSDYKAYYRLMLTKGRKD